VKGGTNLTVTAEVQNSGDRDGDEVVQLYITNQHASVPVPIRSLAGAKRIFLKSHQKQRVSFTLTPSNVGHTTMETRHRTGQISITVGGKQPGFTGAPMRHPPAW
jgi:beta-glucosidase